MSPGCICFLGKRCNPSCVIRDAHLRTRLTDGWTHCHPSSIRLLDLRHVCVSGGGPFPSSARTRTKIHGGGDTSRVLARNRRCRHRDIALPTVQLVSITGKINFSPRQPRANRGGWNISTGKNGRSERTDRAVGAHFCVARKPRSRQRPISSAVVKCALIVHDRCDGTTIFHLQARSNQRTGVGTRARDTRYCSISISVFRCRWPILLS